MSKATRLREVLQFPLLLLVPEERVAAFTAVVWRGWLWVTSRWIGSEAGYQFIKRICNRGHVRLSTSFCTDFYLLLESVPTAYFTDAEFEWMYDFIRYRAFRKSDY